MDPIWWWILAIVLIVAGVIGTFLPVLPGAVLVFGGMLLGAWIDNFERVGWVTLVILGVLTVLVLLVDIVSGFLGAKRVGASRLAIIGAAVGTVVGLAFGIVGVLVAPFIGAVIGEMLERGRLAPAARVGFATWLGMAVGAVAKLALVFVMVGLFLAAYFVG
jgi:uncharacterized protein YqgC (DUF456 family)